MHGETHISDSKQPGSPALTCDAVRVDLPLVWYGELPEAAEAALDLHLTGCSECTQAWEQWKRTFAALDQDVLEPRAALLAECRDELHASLKFDSREPVRWSFRQWWNQVCSGFIVRPLPALAGGLALLTIGFYSSRLTAPANPVVDAEPGNARVRYISPSADGRIRLVVEETRQREVVGRMEDESIRGLLVRAAQNSADPGLRVETVELLNRGSDTSEIRDALLSVLERDANAGVRMKAIEGLKTYAHEDPVRRALSGALLRDTDPGIRMQAIDALMIQRRPDTVGVLQESILREDNDYIRQRTLRALQEMNASAGTF